MRGNKPSRCPAGMSLIQSIIWFSHNSAQKQARWLKWKRSVATRKEHQGKSWFLHSLCIYLFLSEGNPSHFLGISGWPEKLFFKLFSFPVSQLFLRSILFRVSVVFRDCHLNRASKQHMDCHTGRGYFQHPCAQLWDSVDAFIHFIYASVWWHSWQYFPI